MEITALITMCIYVLQFTRCKLNLGTDIDTLPPTSVSCFRPHPHTTSYQHETPRHPTQPHPIRPPAATHASRIHRDPATRGRTSRLEGRQQFGETELHRREATAHVAAIPGHRRGAQIRAVPHRGDYRERTEHAKGRRRRIRKMRRLHLREE